MMNTSRSAGDWTVPDEPKTDEAREALKNSGFSPPPEFQGRMFTIVCVLYVKGPLIVHCDPFQDLFMA